jgi:hypothetical protein
MARSCQPGLAIPLIFFQPHANITTMHKKFWNMMDRFFLLLIEVTGEKEMSPNKISQKEER